MNDLRPRILLAEDEEHIARLIGFKLGRDGCDVVVAPDGQRAVQEFEAGAAAGTATLGWSLVILDVMMPRLDGWEVLRRIRATEAGKAVPILMLTAKGQAASQAAELGATEFLKKPFDPDELSRVVRRLAVR